MNKRFSITCPVFFNTSAKTQKEALSEFKEVQKIIRQALNNANKEMKSYQVIDSTLEPVRIKQLSF